MSSSEAQSSLQRELTTASKTRGLVAGAGWIGDATSAMFVYLHYRFDKKLDADGRLTMRWSLLAKPMSADSMVWVTMFPDNPMGTAAKRIGLRSNGAFAVRGLELEAGTSLFAPAESSAEWAQGELASFSARAKKFIAATPDATDFLGAIDRARAARPDLPWLHSLLKVFTLVANGERERAGQLAHAGVDADQGYFSVGDTTIWQMIARDFDTGAGIFAPGYMPQVP